MVEVTHISKHPSNGLPASIREISFKLRNRRIYGLLGAVGAGKTTLLDMMAGVTIPDEGKILVNGYDVIKQPKEAKKQIGYLSENPRLFPDMTPFELLSFIAEAKGVEDELLAAQVAEALAVTGLTSVQNRLIRMLSKGYQRRVGLAQALIGNPDVILLDEPTTGLDARQSNEIRALIHRLGQTKTVVVSGHIFSELASLCEHIIVLSDGQVVADDVPEALTNTDPALSHVFEELQKQQDEVLMADFEDDTVQDTVNDEVTEVEDAEYFEIPEASEETEAADDIGEEV